MILSDLFMTSFTPRGTSLRPFLVTLLCLSAASAQAVAEMADLPLEQLMQLQVTTASRYAQTTLEAPAAVSIVTAEDIRTFGYRTLADVLASMRGLYVSYDRTYHYLGTRGFSTPGDYNTRVLLLVNGVRFNDNLYDQASIGTDFPLDLDLVERVEFVSGPGSAVYGANAFFGVVNVITRDGRQLGGPQLSTEWGSHGAAKARFSYGTVDSEGRDWLISASRATVRGADQYYAGYDTPASHSGVAHGLDDDRSTALFARVRSEGWTVSLTHGERAKGVPTAPYSQVFNDPRSRYVDRSTRLAAEYTTSLQPSLSMTARVHAGQYEYLGDYVYDYPPLTVNRDVGVGRWWGTEWQWVSTALERHKLVWGVDYRRDLGIRQQNFDVAPYASYLDVQRKDHVLGLYLQDEFALASNLTLHSGVRWDKQSANAGAFHPRLGLVYWWQPTTAVKLLHGTAYRPANAYERDYRVDIPGGVVDSGEIRSERVRTTELAVEHALGQARRVVLTAFRSDVSQLISLADASTPDRLTFGNTRGIRVHGVEAEVDQRGPGAMRLRLAYGWQKAQDKAPERSLTNSPRHLLKAQWSDSVRLADVPGLQGRYAVELLGIGPRRTLLNARLPGHVLTHLVYTTQVAKVDVSLGVYNLFNRGVADPASYEVREDSIRQDGRTFRLKLTYTF